MVAMLALELELSITVYVRTLTELLPSHSRRDRSLAARTEQGAALLEGLLVAQTLLESTKALVLSCAVPVSSGADAAVLVLVISECNFDRVVDNSRDLLAEGVD